MADQRRSKGTRAFDEHPVRQRRQTDDHLDVVIDAPAVELHFDPAAHRAIPVLSRAEVAGGDDERRPFEFHDSSATRERRVAQDAPGGTLLSFPESA